ncbi:hypothetical protein CAY60_004785 [Shouchella clausii]|uniref:Four-helix bundle copper-binding protein n=1 Tax=Shouchella rhizosphaerae TaxID=866786 RepID=A0ABZ2CNB8_9BACI|nr:MULTISPECIES: hypothetical protein [Shouchella]MBU3230421.1 hypothetical protein [Shouchella clausii]MBU3262380.1 hypothetical protein [Shouchella clausii]MBU3507305.1 hypothetical protein [Shouchella clausii]MBU3533463.1 hypothetical protein [Shouchella clausii]MBX0306310.1 hypothetical protein [Shouchella clausii]
MNREDALIKCLLSVHKTLSICSKCLNCCNGKEKELYAELAETSAVMINKLRDAIKK